MTIEPTPPADGGYAASRAEVDGAARFESDVVFTVRPDGPLAGDLVLPAGRGPWPVMVLVHGGGFQAGDKAMETGWARYLASIGVASFAVNYRLSTPERPTFPEALFDVKAAVRFLRTHAGEFGLDSEAIGVMGESAGGHLAAMTVLTSDMPEFTEDNTDPAMERVRIAVPVVGVFDLLARWEHDQLHRPLDHVSEKFLGGTPMSSRETFYKASPLTHSSTAQAAGTRWLVIWGDHDDVVDHTTQALPFVVALKRAGALVRTRALVGADHFWSMPTSVPPSTGGYMTQATDAVGAFLDNWSGWHLPEPTPVNQALAHTETHSPAPA